MRVKKTVPDKKQYVFIAGEKVQVGIDSVAFEKGGTKKEVADSIKKSKAIFPQQEICFN